MKSLNNAMLKKASAYFIELLIVVVGVSIAFQLNVWKDNRKEKKQYQQLLLNLKAENDINFTDLDSTILGQKESIDYASKLIDLLMDRNSNQDSIQYYLEGLFELSWPTFSTTHLENYLTYTSTPTPLREEILLLYGKYSDNKELSQKYVAIKERKYFDYLNDAVDLAEGIKIVDMDKLFRVEFRNNLFIISSYQWSMVDLLTEIQESQQRADELILQELEQ